MTTDISDTARTARTPARGIVLATATAGAVSIAGNLALRGLAVTADHVPQDFIPLRAPAVLILSVASVLLSGLLTAALVRWSRRPAVHLARALALGFALSLLPVLGLAMGSEAEPEMASPGAVSTTVLGLMHVVTLAAVWTTHLPIARRSQDR